MLVGFIYTLPLNIALTCSQQDNGSVFVFRRHIKIIFALIVARR